MYLAVFTDIHGYINQLNQLLSEVEEWMKDEEYQLLFLGDYIDRGPEPQAVIDRVRELQDTKGAIVLKGNHEDMAVQAYFEKSSQYDPRYVPKENDILWMKDLPVKYETDLHYFCHAGVYPGVPLENQDPRHLIWIRDIFLFFVGPFPKYIVHGHTPTNAWVEENVSPDIRPNRCNLDTGICFGGRLSCAIFDTTQVQPIHTISI